MLDSLELVEVRHAVSRDRLSFVVHRKSMLLRKVEGSSKIGDGRKMSLRNGGDKS